MEQSELFGNRFIYFVLSYHVYKMRCQSGQVESLVSPALCHVSIHLSVVQRLKDVIVSRAVVVACTGLDEHHSPLHDLTVRAFELHRKSGCSVGGAATSISADPTEFSSIGLHTGTARELKLDGLGDFGGANTLFAFLNVFLQVCLARSDHAESALLLQSAEGIVIGDSGGDAHSTGLRASTPFCGLDQAVGTHHHCLVRSISVFWSVSS